MNKAFKKVDGLNYVFASSSRPGSYNFSLSWVEGWSPAISFQNSRSRKIGTSRHPHRWAAMRFLDESDLFCHFRRCYFLPFHSILFPIFPKLEEWKEIAISKLLFPSIFLLILRIAIPFHFDCYFLLLFKKLLFLSILK